MPNNIDFFSTYILMALVEEIVPRTSFFKDRYFPTGASDIFAADNDRHTQLWRFQPDVVGSIRKLRKRRRH